MQDTLIRYFLPVERLDGRWRFSDQRYSPAVRTYVIRSGVPTVLFWSLNLVFLQSQPLLAMLCLAVTLPFSYLFGLMLRAWFDLSRT